MFKDITQLVITYTEHGTTNRYNSWAQKARKQARSANRNGYDSVVSRWGGDEGCRKDHNNCAWTRQCVLWICRRSARGKAGSAPERERPRRQLGAISHTEVQDPKGMFANVQPIQRFLLPLARARCRFRASPCRRMCPFRATAWGRARAVPLRRHRPPRDGGTTRNGLGAHLRGTVKGKPA